MPVESSSPAGGRPAADRLDGIDGLRALAALSVFLFHLAEMPTGTSGVLSETWRAIWRHGHLGVSFFFVISGVCIGRTWLRSTTPRTFLRRRFRRIFPAYWGSVAVMIMLVFGVKFFTGTNDVAPLPHSVGAALATLTLTTSPVTPVPALNGVYWSLSYELAFYLMMAALLFVTPSQRTAALATAHTALCVLACWPNWTIVPSAFFVGLWPLFGTGAALALWRDHRRLATLMLLASLIPASAAVVQDRPLGYWIVTLVGTGLCAAALTGRLSFWPKPLVKIGKISYSLYLLHVPVGGYFYLHVLANRGPTTGSEIFWQMLVVFVTAWAIRPFFRCLEEPFLRDSPAAITRPA